VISFFPVSPEFRFPWRGAGAGLRISATVNLLGERDDFRLNSDCWPPAEERKELSLNLRSLFDAILLLAVGVAFSGCAEMGFDMAEARGGRAEGLPARSGDVASWARAAELRRSDPIGPYSALEEEGAAVRAASRALTSADFAIGKWETVEVDIQGYREYIEVYKSDAENALTRSETKVIREHIRRGDQIDHYTDSDRSMRFAYSRVFEKEGRIRDWIRVGKEFNDAEEYSISPRPEATDAATAALRRVDEGKWPDGPTSRPAGPSSWPAGPSSYSGNDSWPPPPIPRPQSSPYQPQTTYHHDLATDYYHDPATDYEPEPTYHRPGD
jgi:hypothetical protein